MLSACANVTQQKNSLTLTETAPEAYENLGYSWWRYSFKLNWPEGEDPTWYLDTLIAHQIIAPILVEFKGDLELWRFHRRAVRDAGGHRFSFIAYTNNQTAAKIYADLQTNGVFAALMEKGDILSLNKQDYNRLKLPEVEDTSDKNWSIELQRSWPYFIMGVSQVWLDLITRYEAQLDPADAEISHEELLLRYESLNERVSSTWQKEAQHAFLHHLNAIFGYVPIIHTERTLMSF